MEKESEQDVLWRALDELELSWHVVDNLPEAVSELEIENIVQALNKHKGNHTLAAKDLGLGRTNLIAKIKKYKIKVNV